MSGSRVFSTLKFLAVAGVGLFIDGYANISIGLVVPIIGYLYYSDTKASIPTFSGDLIKAGMAIGMVCGQLLFGIFGDALGRHRVYGKELMLTIFGTLLLILMPWGDRADFSHQSVVAWLTVFRVVTGFGTGGDYPMTSSLSAESTPLGSRAKLIATVFSNIGLGATSSSIVYIILLAAFKDTIKNNIQHLQWVWRLLFGIGLVPAFVTLYFRLTMPETKPYEKYVAMETSLKNNGQRGLHQQWRDFREYFSQWKHAKALIGVSLSWFLFDIAFYGVNLNQSIILNKIGYGKGATPYATLWNTAVGNLIVQCAGYLPGFYIGIFLPDLVGRVRQQFWCCVVVTVLYAIWAGVSNHSSTGGLITLFTLSQLFLNAGPNVTTFLLPVEVFPTRVRGTAHGIAAASGKVGAIVTAFAFGTMTQKVGLAGTLGFLTGIMALTAAATLLIPETKGLSLDQIEQGVVFGDNVQTLLGSGSSTGPVSPEIEAKEQVFDKQAAGLA